MPSLLAGRIQFYARGVQKRVFDLAIPGVLQTRVRGLQRARQRE